MTREETERLLNGMENVKEKVAELKIDVALLRTHLEDLQKDLSVVEESISSPTGVMSRMATVEARIDAQKGVMTFREFLSSPLFKILVGIAAGAAGFKGAEGLIP